MPQFHILVTSIFLLFVLHLVEMVTAVAIISVIIANNPARAHACTRTHIVKCHYNKFQLLYTCILAPIKHI
jgi:hypothetical protein